MLIDVLNDNNMVVLKDKIAKVEGISDRLEKIASLPLEDRSELAKEAFAWQEEKMFPIYTPAHALISSVYLEDNDEVPDFVKKACEEACDIFGENIRIGSLKKVAEQKEELLPADFLLPNKRKLPVVDSDSFRISKSVLEKVASMLSPEEIIVAYRQLVKKASEMNEEVSDKALALGLYGTINATTARSILHDRKLMTGDQGYIKIASEIKGDRVYSAEKVASIVLDVLALDEKNNFNKTAYETILELVSPGEVSDVFSIDGEEIPTDKIASIDAEEWTDLFPRDIVENLFSDGSLDVSLLKEITESAAPAEKEAIAMFIASKNI